MLGHLEEASALRQLDGRGEAPGMRVRSPVPPASSARTSAVAWWPTGTTSSASTTCPSGRLENLADAPEVRFEQGDVRDEAAVARRPPAVG